MARIDFGLASRLGEIRSPMATAALLLGIYVVMYLAVAGVLHVLDLPGPVASDAAPGESAAVMAGVAGRALSTPTLGGSDTC